MKPILLKCRSRSLGNGRPAFVIAEAGVNHNGDLGRAMQMVDAAAAAGAVLPDDRVMDGVDLVAHLADEIPESADPPHEYLFFRSGAAQAVRDERWKLMVSAPPDGEPQEWLFDLQTATPERGNLMDDHRDIAARLRRTLDTHNAEQMESRWPWTITSQINVDRDLSQPDQPSDEFAYWSN